LANRAIQAESAISSLSPLTSPLPTLQKAFPLYISAASSYSYLITSNLVPDVERPNIKKRWRLVLERAEKVKTRIKELGGVVGKAVLDDEGEESAIIRRGGIINGISAETWRSPNGDEFKMSKTGEYIDVRQPVLAREQVERGAIWQRVEAKEWDVAVSEDEKWVIRQGPGADCSVVAGLSVCYEHDRKHQTKVTISTCMAHGPDDLACTRLALPQSFNWWAPTFRKWEAHSQIVIERGMEKRE
jgi:calpain-7